MTDEQFGRLRDGLGMMSELLDGILKELIKHSMQNADGLALSYELRETVAKQQRAQDIIKEVQRDSGAIMPALISGKIYIRNAQNDYFYYRAGLWHLCTRHGSEVRMVFLSAEEALKQLIEWSKQE